MRGSIVPQNGRYKEPLAVLKPTAVIPDGDTVRFQANNLALWENLDGTPVHMDTSDKSRNNTQAPHLEGIEAVKTTTSKTNWFLTPFLSPRL